MRHDGVSRARREEATVTVLEAESAVDKFDAPLYTLAEASRFLGLSESTFRNWSRGYHSVIQGREVTGKPVITAVGKLGQRGPAIPFLGLAEGYALAAIRRTGVPLQRIRPALERLNTEMGVEHALASEKLVTDGAEVLFDYAAKAGGTKRRRCASSSSCATDSESSPKWPRATCTASCSAPTGSPPR